MAKVFQPRVEDKDKGIRKSIDRIYKATKIAKSKIAEMGLKRGLAHIEAESIGSPEQAK
jgi:hypothetical protein